MRAGSGQQLRTSASASARPSSTPAQAAATPALAPGKEKPFRKFRAASKRKAPRAGREAAGDHVSVKRRRISQVPDTLTIRDEEMASWRAEEEPEPACQVAFINQVAAAVRKCAARSERAEDALPLARQQALLLWQHSEHQVLIKRSQAFVQVCTTCHVLVAAFHPFSTQSRSPGVLQLLPTQPAS